MSLGLSWETIHGEELSDVEIEVFETLLMVTLSMEEVAAHLEITEADVLWGSLTLFLDGDRCYIVARRPDQSLVVARATVPEHETEGNGS